MAPAEPPIREQPNLLLLSSLAMALGIVVFVLLTLLALHFLLKRLHSRTPPAPPPLRTNQMCHGVDNDVLDSLPIHTYDKDLKFLQPDRQRECCVCLSAFEEGALVRVLPACRHVFHCQCIDAWLASRSSCPFCRAEVLTAAESFVVSVDATDEPNGSGERGCRHVRSSSSVWPVDCGLLSFTEKLRLKRCASLRVM